MEQKKSSTVSNVTESDRMVDNPNRITVEPIDWRAAFLDEHHNCPLCGGELLLTNVTQFVNQEVREEAHCDDCNVRIRQATHPLQ